MSSPPDIAGAASPDDADLLATFVDDRAPAGRRQDAFRTLVGRYQRRVFAVCLRTLGSTDDAEEATQETFVRLARGARGFRGDAQLSTWLYRVARNVCTDEIRRQVRRPSTPVEDITPLADRTPEPDDTALVDTTDAVGRALASLDETSRRLLLLIAVDGLSYQEAADAAGLAVGTVKSRVSRARVQLGAVLGAGTPGTRGPGPRAVTLPTPDPSDGRPGAPRGPP